MVNLGIKQPIANILQAVTEHRADAIGMSGLLVKSTVVMRENLEEMSRRGVAVPVLLGGAALTRKYVEEDCVAVYAGGRVAYARDAFAGLGLMDKVMTGQFDTHIAALGEQRASRPSNQKRTLGRATEPQRPIDVEEIRLRRAELTARVPVPVPPFWGPRVIARVPSKALVPYLNETMLYQFQWGFRKQGKKIDEYKAWAQQEVKPILKRMLEICTEQDILVPQAAYGYWRCAADGNDVILFEEDGSTEVARFALPRQARERRGCASPTSSATSPTTSATSSGSRS
ncbi:MAG: cobalamin-dependent protein [Pseudomonadota bacterium]